MAKLKRDNVTLFYKEAGSGDPPILLVHGGMDDQPILVPSLNIFNLIIAQLQWI